MRLPFLFKLIFNRYFFEKIVALSILGLIMYALQSFLLIILFAFLFAYLFLDLAKWLSVKITYIVRSIRSRPVRSILLRCNKLPILISIIYLAFISIVGAMFYSLIPQLIEETKGLVKIAPQITSQLQNAADSLQSQVSFDL
jgi:predicted PurR-regulated permease PerM